MFQHLLEGFCRAIRPKNVQTCTGQVGRDKEWKALCMILMQVTEQQKQFRSAFFNGGATCQVTVANPTSVTLTAAAATGSSFTGWSGACTGTAATCVVSMNAAKSVTATFALLPVQLTVAAASVPRPCPSPRRR